jgi:hypothetical protein
VLLKWVGITTSRKEAWIVLYGAIFTGQTAYFGEQNVYGNFAQINWSPSGTPRYRFALGTWGAPDNTLNVGSPATIPAPVWTGNLNNVKEADGTTTMTPAPHISWIDNATTAFTAGAGGIISTSVKSDCWSINQKRQLVWTQDGT